MSNMPRRLPHRPEAENAVLGGVLLGGRPALAEALTLITENEFYQPRAQAVFRAMRILDERGEPIDVITLEGQLRRTGELELCGGIEGLARLDRYATAHNIKAHAELILEASQVREAVVAAREIAEQGMEDVEDTNEFLDRAEERMQAVRARRRKGGPSHVRDSMMQVFKGITERQRADTKISGLPTPWDRMNEMTSGLQPTDLIILAARPSMGKSAAALNMAEEVAITPARYVHTIEQYAQEQFGAVDERATRSAYRALVEAGQVPRRAPVLFFSLEMSKESLIERALCSQGRVDANQLRSGTRLHEGDFRSLIAAADRLSRFSDLYIDDRAALSITTMTSTARVWADEHLEPIDPEEPDGKKWGLIMVDYLQLARGSKKNYASREQEISEISRGLKAMAKELKVPVIALAQLNRAVDSRADHRPQLSDLRESGAIEQDADVIMFIYREERYLPADAPEEKRREVENKAEIIIGKQRNGPIGTVPLTFVKKHTRFETPAPDYPDYGVVH